MSPVERRKFPRKDARLNVICQSQEVPPMTVASKSINISQGGLCLKIKNFFLGCGLIEVMISRPFWGEPVSAKGRVVWQREAENPGESIVGVQFTDVSWTRITDLVIAV